MRYGSVCSGIEAATVAWHGLGWEPIFFSEIEKFPREVLAHHYPDVPLHGDFTTIGANEYGAIDLLVGGTPCQSFSIAGLRKGLDDERGNLALEFLKLSQRTRPRWVVWENVTGVLSSNGGRDFGTFLGALGEIGYGFAYRILDAQYFGVAQRRRRVFVVGYVGDWRRSTAVLFERESLSGNPAPSREKGEKPARTITESTRISRTGNERVECDAYIPSIANCLQTTCDDYNRADGFNMMAFQSNANVCDAVAAGNNISPTMRVSGSPAIAGAYGVRRLTPIECERLQGFPDGYTDIKEKTPDSPRYKAIGNSMAVPVMKWIGERIQQVEDLCECKL